MVVWGKERWGDGDVMYGIGDQVVGALTRFRIRRTYYVLDKNTLTACMSNTATMS